MEVSKTHIVVFKTERNNYIETVIYECPGNIWYINYPTYHENLSIYTYRLVEISSEVAQEYLNQ